MTPAMGFSMTNRSALRSWFVPFCARSSRRSQPARLLPGDEEFPPLSTSSSGVNIPTIIINSASTTMSTIEINAGQLGIRYLIDGSQTASMGMFELTVPPGSNVPPPHSHSNNEEIVYVLEGTLRYTVDSDTRRSHSGGEYANSEGHGSRLLQPVWQCRSRTDHSVSGHWRSILQRCCRRRQRGGSAGQKRLGGRHESVRTRAGCPEVTSVICYAGCAVNDLSVVLRSRAAGLLTCVTVTSCIMDAFAGRYVGRHRA